MTDGTDTTGQEGRVIPTPETTTTPPVVDERYKGLQREYQKLQDRLKTYEQQGSDLATLRDELASVRSALEILARPDKTNELGEPDASKLQEIEKLRRQMEQKTLVESGRRAVQEHLESMAGTFGLGLDTPQAEESLRLFKTGNYDGAIKTFHKAAAAHMKAQADAAKAEADAVKAQQEAHKQGLLDAETGGSGGLSTFAQIQDAYARGQVSYTKYAEALQAKGENL